MPPTDVFGERAAAGAEDLVAGLERGHVRADSLDDAGDVGSRNGLLRPPEPEHEPRDERRAAGHVPVGGIDAGGADADEDVVLPHLRPVDLLESEQVGRAVLPLHDRLHTASVRQRDATHCPLAILPT